MFKKKKLNSGITPTDSLQAVQETQGQIEVFV
jgi:hypothetical protein